jgi:hypothetical protein
MLGFGAIGEFALGEVGGQALALSSDILEKVVTHLVEEKNYRHVRLSFTISRR